MENKNLPKNLKIGIWSASMFPGAILAFLFSMLFLNYWSLSVVFPIFAFGVILMLGSLLMPFAGIVLGIVGLCVHSEPKSELGKALNITAIVLPLAIVAVLSFLFATGIAVIRFM